MAQCPECGHENPDDKQFCAQCHHTMFYRCPKCWHQQLTAGVCDKCGFNMGAYWTRQVATARAVLVKEEGASMEESANHAIATINTVGMALGIPFFSWGRALLIIFSLKSEEGESAAQQHSHRSESGPMPSKSAIYSRARPRSGRRSRNQRRPWLSFLLRDRTSAEPHGCLFSLRTNVDLRRLRGRWPFHKWSVSSLYRRF